MGSDIGVIGTGTIATALVTGFCQGEDLEHRIHLSPRNARRAAELAARFPNVTVARSNQEVIDRSEWVVVAVLPQVGEQVLRPLSFRADHRVINVMAGRTLPEIASWIGPTRTLVHLVPISFVARRIGPLAMYPYDPAAEALLTPLGNLVVVSASEKMQVLQTITSLIASYYNLLRGIVEWGQGYGLERDDVLAYTAAFFEALSSQARLGGAAGLEGLAEEMTPGGFNEMVLRLIQDNRGVAAWIDALEPALTRLRG